jgi:HAD superfamily hydrolase (TIGR01450 family)
MLWFVQLVADGPGVRLGHAPSADVDEDLADHAAQLRAEPPPLSPAELRRRFPAGISDEELLLRATMPAGEVDAMLAAGPAPGTTTRTWPACSACSASCAAGHRSGSWWSTSPASGSSCGATRMPADLPSGMAGRLRAVRGFVLDLDGTLVLRDARNHRLAPLPGALEFTQWLYMQNVPFVLLTNGTTRPPGQLAQALRGIGFAVADGAVLTPAASAARVLRRRGHRRVLVLGGDGLAGPLRAAGLDVLPPAGPAPADAVLAGWYPEFTLPALEAACHAVWAGAPLYSCSQSRFFATAGGRAMGTSRAISAMIRSVTGCRVHLAGKPSLAALGCVARQLGVRAREVAVVGDDPDLEVPTAHRGRALAIAVGTGIGGAGAFDHLPPARRPHLTVAGVDELLAICQRAGR